MGQAFDAETGKLQWIWKPPAWGDAAGKGDAENLLTRVFLGIKPQCNTASWGRPAIGGDGVVYAPHMSGKLFAIKDFNGDGIIDEGTEVSSFDAGCSFLGGGPSCAPGTMA